MEVSNGMLDSACAEVGVSTPSTREVGKVMLLDVKAQSGQRSLLPIQATLCSRKDLFSVHV